MLVLATPAAAHTAFESSSPVDGATIDEPVTQISLTFTAVAMPAGEGFVILDPAGNVREPDEVSSVDDLTWILRFDEPLTGGAVGVRWTVAAPDTHPIEGSFSFVVTAPATGSPSDSTNTGEENIGEENIGEQNSAATTHTPPAPEAEPVDLGSFLETEGVAPRGAVPIGAAGRIVSIAGAVLTIGGMAFVAYGLRGHPADIRAVLFWVRRGGVLVVIGAAIEAIVQVGTLAGSWAGLVSFTRLADVALSSAGAALAMRVAGGTFVATRTNLATQAAKNAADPVLAARKLATVGAAHDPAQHTRPDDEPFVYSRDHSWDGSSSVAAIAGAALIAVSFAFDGHTVSEGPRVVHGAINLIHVITATTWAGGVAMLTYVIGRRHRRRVDTRALQLAMRFSVIATLTLICASVAGVAMSVIVLDSLSDIWTTSWGQLLSVKVALVGIASVAGAYNHLVVVPALDRAPDDAETRDRFRGVLAIEAVVLIAVTVVTALLVAASST